MGHLRGRGTEIGSLSNKPILLRCASARLPSRSQRVTTRGFQPATSFTPSIRYPTFPQHRPLVSLDTRTILCDSLISGVLDTLIT